MKSTSSNPRDLAIRGLKAALAAARRARAAVAVVSGAEAPARRLRRRVPKHAGIVMALAMVMSRPAAAQDQRLDRLTPETRALIGPVLDSVRAAGLPMEPLVERALEGTSKHASPELIVTVVRRLVSDLARAREALGPDAGPEDLAAGADALHAGAAPTVLQRLARALGPGRLAVPLAVTADLTARGVPADSAATLTLARARSTSDADLLALERDVERDIALGANPLGATAGRFSGTDVNAPAQTGFSGGQPGLPGTTQLPPKPHKP